MARTFASTIPCHVLIMTADRRAAVWSNIELLQVIEAQEGHRTMRYVHCEPHMTILYGEDETLSAVPDENLPFMREAVHIAMN